MSAAIRASFARQTMMRTFGAELTELGAGLAVIEAPILPLARQQHGYGHAALTFALGDTAAGYAAATLMPEGAEPLTAELKINLLRPCAGERLVARGRVVKPGRRILVVSATVSVCREAGEVEVALLQGTMIPA